MKRNNIFIVEDNPNNLRLIQQLLLDLAEDYGLELNLICSTSGNEAMRNSNLDSCSLVLLDMSLPDMNGSQIATKLRVLPTFASTPMIVITAHAMAKEKEALLQIFDDYISKPIDEDYFYEKIIKWMEF